MDVAESSSSRNCFLIFENDLTKFFCSLFKIVYARNPFLYFWLYIPGQYCTLCGTQRMWTFIITPIASLVSTVIFTVFDIQVRTWLGKEPRAPIITFQFDKVDDDGQKVEKDLAEDGAFEDDILEA